MPTTSALALIAALGLLTTAGRGEPRRNLGAVKITKRKGKTRIDARRLPVNARHGATRGGLNPKISRYALKLLRDYAEGKAGPLRGQLGRSRRTAAKRIVARIEALPQRKRNRALAGGGRGGKDRFPSNTMPYVPGTPGVGLGAPTDTLPAQDQGIIAPSAFSLKVAGLRSLAAQEQGGDELVAVAAFVASSGSGYETHVGSLPGNGTLSVDSGNATAQAVDVFEGTGGGVLVSGVFEIDGAPAGVRAEFETMLGLASALASQIGDDQVADLAFAVDYSAGLLSLSDPDKWPPGSVVKTIIPAASDDPMSLLQLYVTPTETAQGIKHKIVHAHSHGSGSYELLFNVPAPPIQKSNVVVRIKKLESLDGVDDGADQDDMVAAVAIGNESWSDWKTATHTFLPNKDVLNTTWVVQRKMSESVAQLRIYLRDFSEGPESGVVSNGWTSAPCGSYGGKQYQPCPDTVTSLDIDSKQGEKAADLFVDLETGAITGSTTAQVGETFTLQGTETPRGRMTIKITVED